MQTMGFKHWMEFQVLLRVQFCIVKYYGRMEWNGRNVYNVTTPYKLFRVKDKKMMIYK